MKCEFTLYKIVMKIFVFLLLLLFVNSCQYDPVKDIDGNTYKVVKIGSQLWTTSNSNVSTFQNGDTIPHVANAEEWQKAGEEGRPAWSYYGNESSNAEKYGKLYNWYAVTDERGIAPEGWRVPTDEDWKILEKTLGGGEKAGKSLKSKSEWTNKVGNNSSGFNALPGGYRNYKGDYESKGKYGAFWTSSESIDNMAWYRYLFDENNQLNRLNFNKQDGMSLRWVKDVK